MKDIIKRILRESTNGKNRFLKDYPDGKAVFTNKLNPKSLRV